MGGIVRRTVGGVPTGRGGREAAGWRRCGGETVALASAAVAAGDEAGAVVGAAVIEAEAAGEGIGVGLGLCLTLGDGRTRGEAEAEAVLAGPEVALGDGRTLAEAEACGVLAGAALALGAIVGLGPAGAVAGTVVAAEVAAGATVDVSPGFTNFLGGALGGGVASARIFVRARSAAERSVTPVQPFSTFTSVTRSFTRRGRDMLRTSLNTGTETSNSAPCTLAGASKLRSRRKR
jgi:hypothetical protein